MKSKIRDMWADALESGNYKQGREQLRSMDDKFCAFGVLCELAVQNGIIDPPEVLTTGDGIDVGYRYAGLFAQPSSEVRAWAGHLPVAAIYTMNDEKHNNFKTIAKFVRSL